MALLADSAHSSSHFAVAAIKHSGATRASKPRITVLDLPPEILIIIIDYASHAVCHPQIQQGHAFGIHIAALPPYDDPNPRYPFPECFASVSPLWREAMSISSVFWPHFVIWIGRDPTPLPRIREYLAWSRDRPLHIYILRRLDPSASLQAPWERAQVKAVIRVLLPSIRRWATLCMKVLRASSIPLPCLDLVGRADMLETLVLDFLIDDLVYREEMDSHLAGALHTPALKKLSMGGVHFRWLFVGPFPLLAMPPNLTFLSIAGYSRHDAPFLVFDLLTCLRSCWSLRGLTLDNLHLLCWESHGEIFDMQHWQADVHFIDMDASVIAEYSRLLGHPCVERMSYTRCWAPAGFHELRLPESDCVKLEEIHDATTLLTLFTTVPYDSQFRDAWFKNCDGLTTDIMNKLAGRVRIAGPEAENPWFYLCPYLEALTIEGCKQFSSTDVRVVFEMRLKLHEETGFVGPDDPGFLVLSLQYLNVRDCCDLAPEDKEWFHANVRLVVWDDWVGGYGFTA
ncbi:hypothetical protein EVJ58_g5304 [Rhodofomes roseus]|uniref:F-box domain-containing protein n=1 Tax=Rhodofomes roseus TaxID=34475 RepID=A0A4Y9YCB2_9APHY|nr:hypothetical protein EVJ58_g5304 [Rhodofomes roseus]